MRFRCDRTERLADALNLGSVDVAYLTNAINPSGIVVAEWLESMVWVKGPKFVLTPGAPVPLVSWPGTLPDQVAVERLQANGTHYLYRVFRFGFGSATGRGRSRFRGDALAGHNV